MIINKQDSTGSLKGPVANTVNTYEATGSIMFEGIS
jgi:hypothetical protein